MRLRSISLALVGILWSGMVHAQQVEELVFSEKTFDFGTIKEEDGPIIHEFSFVNKGMEPLKITGVKASCGCTTPDWTKEPVAPGETGFIQAQYDPKNRPGSFNKSLTVTTDGSETPIRLYIRGKVEPKAQKIEDKLGTEMGGLRMKYRSFNMGKVKTSDEPTAKEFATYNMSKTPIKFLEEQQTPDYIKLEFEPQELAPGEEGIIRIIYDAKAKNDLGFSSDNVKFYTNEGGLDGVKSISIYATVEEYFPPMTQEQLDAAPRLHLTEFVHDFGRIKTNEKVATTFTLSNTGKEPLSIRQTKSNCTCTVAKVKQRTLQPGESTEMEVVFDAEGRRGNQQKSVTIYSNDPRASAQRVTVKGYVKDGD